MADSVDDAVKSILNRVSRELGHGDKSRTIFNTFYGINHRGTGWAVPQNTDHHGLTFFTRPNLNLSYDNICGERIFLPLLDKRPNSIFRAIRCYLDPDATDDYQTKLTSPLVNPNYAFIPLLSNTLLSISGWNDVVADTYTSKEGRARQSWSMVDGIVKDYRTTGLSGSFRNIIGDPITLLFFYWVQYASLVYEGKISAKPECIIEREIDYNTRIYRLVLDSSRKYVKKIYANGVGFPTSSPIGASANFSTDSPVNRENDQVSINFQSSGFQYMDPILIREFNTTVQMFNPSLSEAVKKQHIKIPESDLTLFNGRGYPWINPLTYELEWYIEEAIYRRELDRDANVLYPSADYGVVINDNPISFAEAIKQQNSIVQPPVF